MGAVSVRVKDTDKGFRRRMRDLISIGKVRLTVGVHGEQGGEAAKGAPGMTVGDLAAIHEFGLGVPQRSFIGGWADRNKAKNEKTLATLFKPVAAGKRTAEQAMQLAGARFKGDIQKGFASPPLAELAESTKKAKGSDVPLVDTGQLRSSIDYKVTTTTAGMTKTVAEGSGIAGAKKRKARKMAAQRKKDASAAKKARTARVKAFKKGATKATKSVKKSLKSATKTARKAVKSTAKNVRRSVRGSKKKRRK